MDGGGQRDDLQLGEGHHIVLEVAPRGQIHPVPVQRHGDLFKVTLQRGELQSATGQRTIARRSTSTTLT